MSELRQRLHRQHATLHRDRGTIRFFRRHRWLLRGHTRPIAQRALAFARSEIRWTLRELAETRHALTPPVRVLASSARASWYGPGFYGNQTACGQTLTTGLLGVAHKTLACGTRLVVCYRGRCAHASVVDRGPYVAGREFDLTGGLAVALGFNGVDTISYEVAGA